MTESSPPPAQRKTPDATTGAGAIATPAERFAAKYERETGRKLEPPAELELRAEHGSRSDPKPPDGSRSDPKLAGAVARPRISVAERKRRDRARKCATRDRRARADAEREAKLYERLKQRLADLGASLDSPPPMIPLWIWRMGWLVIGDATGRAARMFLRRLRGSNAAAVGAILRALFGDEAGNELPAESSWSDLDTRRTCAAGLAVVHLARRHRKRGPWGAQARGIPAGAFCAMLHNPFDPRPAVPARVVPGARKPSERLRRPGTPHRNTVFGVHNEARGELGYMVRLRNAGLFISFQMPKALAKAYEIGPSGYPYARYDVITARAERTTTPEQAGAVTSLAELAAEWSPGDRSSSQRERAAPS